MNPAKRANRGFTMLEVLVALFIVSVGMLGIGILQIRGERYTRDAWMDSLASSLAARILEEMRTVADRTRDPASTMQFFDSRITPPPALGGNGCTTADLHNGNTQKVVACWYQRVAASLPGGNAEIRRTAGDATPDDISDDEYRVTIIWTAGNEQREKTWSFIP